MAGPRPSLCRILTLLQEEGPAPGIIINLPKCEVFNRHGLDMFPLDIKKSDKPNMEILGLPWWRHVIGLTQGLRWKSATT